jgi:hypothetical protein
MQYAEILMTDGKADPVHNSSVAFSNCMIRIPNSYNSKYIPKNSNGEPILSSITPQSRVRIEQLSNGYKPNIRYLLEGLWESLIQLRNDGISDRLLDEQRRIRFEIRHPYNVGPRPQYQNNRIGWIEHLIEKPLGDFRKYCITFIFVPYFINIRRLSDLDAFDRIRGWLEKCKSVHRLDFNIKQRVKYDIKSVRRLQRDRRFVKPKALHKIKTENAELYTLLQKQGILH